MVLKTSKMKKATKTILLFALFLIAWSIPRTFAQQTVKSEGWIVNDQFQDNRNFWVVDSTTEYDYKISNGDYVMDRVKAGISTNTFFLDDQHDYKIETVLENFYGKKDAYGLCFGRLNDRQFFFLITNDGYYKIIEQADTVINTIKDFTFSSAIRAGEGVNSKTNTITLIKLKNTWSFRVNDVEIYSCNAKRLPGHQFGFFIPAVSHVFAYSFKIYDWDVAKASGDQTEPIRNSVFADDFHDNKHEWGDLNDDDIYTMFDGTDYVIKCKYTGHYMSWQSIKAMDFLSHQVELSFRHTDGIKDYGHGLIFGTKDINNAWVFMISGDGHFQIGSYSNGDWSAIKSWTGSDAIRTKDYSINYLRLEKISGKWNFYINDKLVYSCPSKNYFGDRFGCYVENKQTVQFLNFNVWTLSLHSD
jgi:hypothetical protein